MVTEARNWNPDCSCHGLKSKWYNSPEQQKKREEQNERLRELQTLAREKRQEAARRRSAWDDEPWRAD